MALQTRNPSVDVVMADTTQWRDEFELLRTLILDCGLTEALKWGQPCYATEGKNVLLIHGFKEYCAILFMKGALLKDPNGLLVQQTRNVQSARQIRFRHSGEISQLEPVLKAYVREAIEVEKAGLQVAKKATGDFEMAPEFQVTLDASPALKAAFEALTPGRQRGYLLYFAAAKRAETREERVKKCTPRILDGKGLDD